MPGLILQTLELRGDAAARGAAHGEAMKETIAAFVDNRINDLTQYLTERGHPKGVDTFFEKGAQCLSVLKSWHPDGYDEHVALSKASGQSPERLYAIANMTDVRDIVVLSKTPDAEGCSSVLLPPEHTGNNHFLVGQTWDLNPGDIKYMVAIYVTDEKGLEWWSVTCAGCPSLMGMNALGVAVGTTNIKTYGAKVGVGYLSLLHRAIQAANVGEAREAIETAPRIGAHTYWLADEKNAVELECSPAESVPREVKASPVYRTNHCLAPAFQKIQGEPTNESSQKRYEKLGQLLSARDFDYPKLKGVFADRSDGVFSINRYHEDDQGTATNACLIAEPKTRSLWACQGPSDRGEWQKLGFSRRVG